jgi:SRSO17 transposase
MEIPGWVARERTAKTGWMRAEAAGDPGPWRQQAILGRGQWDAEALRDIVREYAPETLANGDAVLVIDETSFLKQGKASYVVARQYTGSAGKITNCQIGVFASYVSHHGHALYLPQAWTDDPERMTAAHVPDDVSFATKPQIARKMIALATAAKVPFSFVAADSVYGTGELETALRKAGKGYFSALPPTMCSIPGARSRWFAGAPQRSRKIFPKAHGDACRQAMKPKASACMTGPISNSPISMPANTTARSVESGRGVY